MKAKAGLVFLLASGAALVSAKPMPPFPVPVIQGDGDTLSVQLHGDEYSHYAETSDGYLLLKGEDGYYYYADSSASISPFRARNADRRDSADKMFLNGLDREKVKSLYINDKMEVRERKSYGTPARKRGSALYKPSADTWTLGEQTFLMILVNHTGATWTHTREAYDSLLNQTGYSRNNHFGSVRDYYIRQSGGLFQPTFKVIGPYNVGMSVAGNDVKVMQAALDSAVKAGDLTDLSVYAKESDGHVFVGLVLAGNTSQGAGSGVIYMGWNDRSRVGKTTVGRYVYIPELGDYNSTELDGMGTFAHEFGHVLGLPDLYQTNTSAGTRRTPGNYDVMDVGCYNNWESNNVYGTHVPNMSSLERGWLGWLSTTQLSAVSGVYSVPGYDSANFAYEIPTADTDQWFALENRTQSGWDSSIPGHGLLIWHIDYDQDTWDKNGVNNDVQYVDIEEADTTAEGYYTYPGEKKVTSFDGFYDWSGTKAYGAISDIRESGGYVCFSVGGAVISQCPPAAASSIAAPQTAVPKMRASVHGTELFVQGASEVEIYSLNGSLLLKKTVSPSGVSVSLDGLNAKLCIVKMTGGTRVRTQRIVVY